MAGGPRRRPLGFLFVLFASYRATGNKGEKYNDGQKGMGLKNRSRTRGPVFGRGTRRHQHQRAGLTGRQTRPFMSPPPSSPRPSPPGSLPMRPIDNHHGLINFQWWPMSPCVDAGSGPVLRSCSRGACDLAAHQLPPFFHLPYRLVGHLTMARTTVTVITVARGYPPG